MTTVLKRAASMLAVLALAFSVIAGTELPAQAAGGCTIKLSSYTTVGQGSRGSRTKAAQCLLRKAGHSVRADGSFSATDAANVKRFQARVGLTRTGEVDRQTWTALIARGSRLTLKVGSRGQAVRRLQAALRAAGHKVAVTGHYGAATKNAVKALQGAQGWRETGRASGGVWRALQAGGMAQLSLSKAAKRSTGDSGAAKKKMSSKKGKKALAFAKRQLGDRYRYGGTGPNTWDCSGLTRGAWRAAGKKLPRTSQDQYRVGRKVSKSNLRAGDLVFFYSGVSHVGIYAGNRKIIHASRPGKPVGYIKMRYMPYKGARRPA